MYSDFFGYCLCLFLDFFKAPTVNQPIMISLLRLEQKLFCHSSLRLLSFLKLVDLLLINFFSFPLLFVQAKEFSKDIDDSFL